MGIIRMGPPEELILLLKQHLNVSVFVETGTFKGGTATWAANHFKKVFTIENSKMYFEESMNNYKHLKNIEFLFGNSRAVLGSVVTKIHEPAIFWLDAHWCGMDSYGSNDQCPIIEEINLICSTGIKHCIFIDDARLFMSPPPLPNVIEQWPSIDKVIEALKSSNHKYYTVIFEDVIIAVPEYAKEPVACYCQEINTRAWEEYGERLSESAIKQGGKLTVQGLRLVGIGLLYTPLKRLASKLVKSVRSK